MTGPRRVAEVGWLAAVGLLAMVGLLAAFGLLAMVGLLAAGPAFAADAPVAAHAATGTDVTADAHAAAAASAAAARPLLKQGDVSYTFEVGTFTPEYTPPPPGTYELPPFGTIRDHPLVDADGHDTTLAKVIGGRLAVVSFVYGTCGDATGCPLSMAVLHRLDSGLAADPKLAREVALVTVSFDPERDAPRLAEMQKHRATGSTWQFVTTRDEASLAPLLGDFGQSVSKLLYADGTWSGVYRHVLKVFLLDRRSRVRNIYSVGFLNPELVKNDLETLRMAGAK